MPLVTATEACAGLRPVAKAFGESCGMSQSLGIGKPIRWQRFRTIGATRAYTSGFSVSLTGCAEYDINANFVGEEITGEVHANAKNKPM